MGKALHRGDIPAQPLENICEYCDYACVCGREKNNPALKMDKLKNQEVLKRLEEEESDGAE